MASATEYAEHRNRQRWPAFDWLKEPQEAFLAFRDWPADVPPSYGKKWAPRYCCVWSSQGVPLLRQSRFHDDPEIPPSVGKSIG